MVFCHAEALSVRPEDLDLGHRIPGDRDDCDVIRHAVPGQEIKRVRLSGVRLPCPRLRFFPVVDPKEQVIAQMIVVIICRPVPDRSASVSCDPVSSSASAAVSCALSCRRKYAPATPAAITSITAGTAKISILFFDPVPRFLL